MKNLIKLLWCVGLVFLFSCEEDIDPTSKELSWERLDGVNYPYFNEGSNIFWTNNQLYYEKSSQGYRCDDKQVTSGTFRYSTENKAWYQITYEGYLPLMLSSNVPYMSNVNNYNSTFSLQVHSEPAGRYGCDANFYFYQVEYNQDKAIWRKLDLPYNFRTPSELEEYSGKGHISNLVYNKNGSTILMYDPIIGIREYDIYAEKWSTLTTENDPPPREYGSIIVYAENDNSLFLFGAEDDIWKLDFGSNRWKRLENKYQFTNNDRDTNSGEDFEFYTGEANKRYFETYDQYVYEPNQHRVIIQKAGKLYQYDIKSQVWKNLKVINPFSSSTDIGGFTIDAEKSILYQFNERGLYKLQL